MIGFEEYDPCPECYHSETESRQCEHEINHEGSHVFTVWHSESDQYEGLTYWEQVPDGPFFWDTQLRCSENGLICPEPNGLFDVHPSAPDEALLSLLMHMHYVHGIGWLTALDSIQNEITAWKVTPV